MPELPEVETVRRGLESLVVGATIESATVWRDSTVRLHPGGKATFADALAGATIAAAVRRGKFLWLPLAGPSATPVEALSTHLGMSGQFRVFEGDAPQPHRHARARLGLLRDGRRLWLDFIDQRTFGYLHVEALRDTPDAAPGGKGSDLAAVPASVAHIGRDAMDPALDTHQALRKAGSSTRGIKQVLLDQTLISGIGNIYADEALWRAMVHPQTQAAAVGPQRLSGVVNAVREVMSLALERGGTSFDALYVNVNGESGYFSRDLDAYGRAGEPCSRCGTPLSRARVHGRSTHWCSHCQMP